METKRKPQAESLRERERERERELAAARLSSTTHILKTVPSKLLLV
jgi:hypothetical protein